MKKHKELLELLIKYDAYIEKGNTLLKKKFNTELPPLLAKRAGLIPANGIIESETEKVIFRFHGMGCRFEFDEVVVEFDYSFGDFVYKGFQTLKLFWFIESLPNANSDFRIPSVYNEALQELEMTGKIVKKDSASPNTFDYSLVIF